MGNRSPFHNSGEKMLIIGTPFLYLKKLVFTSEYTWWMDKIAKT